MKIYQSTELFLSNRSEECGKVLSHCSSIAVILDCEKLHCQQLVPADFFDPRDLKCSSKIAVMKYKAKKTLDAFKDFQKCFQQLQTALGQVCYSLREHFENDTTG